MNESNHQLMARLFPDSMLRSLLTKIVLSFFNFERFYMNVKNVLLDVLHEEKQTMADEYIRMNEVLEFVYSYFAFNIDEVAGDEIGELSLNQLSQVLQKKINLYKKYVRTDKVGVFAEANEEA